MRNLAKAASGFVLAIGMYVGRDLQKERERKQCERERRWPGEFAEDGMYSEQHFRASPKRSSSWKGPPPHPEKGPYLIVRQAAVTRKLNSLIDVISGKMGCNAFNRY
jgi:hypothetical protein